MIGDIYINRHDAKRTSDELRIRFLGAVGRRGIDTNEALAMCGLGKNCAVRRWVATGDLSWLHWGVIKDFIEATPEARQRA